MDAGLEVGREFVVRPGPYALLAVGGDIRRVPVVDRPAREGALGVRLHREPLGRMAVAAMAEAFDEVGAAIHLGRLRWVGPEFALMEEERVPSRHAGADVEGKVRRVFLGRPVRRRDRSQVRPDRKHVVARDFGEPLVGERRIEVFPVVADALVHRAIELLVRPAANPLLRVGGYVGGVEGAVWQFNRRPSGKGRDIRLAVACDAIACCCEIGAPRHERGIRLRGLPWIVPGVGEARRQQGQRNRAEAKRVHISSHRPV